MKVGFNQRNEVDMIKNNKEDVAFNKLSTPFAYLYQRGNVPLDLVLFEQKVEEINIKHPLPPPDKKFLEPDKLKLPELMPYRNITPPYQKQRYKQDMRMKSLDVILQYKKDHEKTSMFTVKQFDRPIKYYKDSFNASSESALQRIKQEGLAPKGQSGVGQFIQNTPNHYANKGMSNSQMRNLGLENMHQYKVMASENENRVNYGIYDNAFPQVVQDIQKQYKYQKELISDQEHNFFKQSKPLNYRCTPLAAQQYDHPYMNTRDGSRGGMENDNNMQFQEQQSNSQFQMMSPVMPIYVPVNERLPKNYQVIMPGIPSPIPPVSNAPTFQLLPGQTVEVTPFKKAPLRPGKFTEIQKNNRFIEPTAERYSQQKRHEKMDENYTPDLLQRADKAGYNMNPHTTAVTVNYQRQENNNKRAIKEEEAKEVIKKQKEAVAAEFYQKDNRFGTSGALPSNLL